MSWKEGLYRSSFRVPKSAACLLRSLLASLSRQRSDSALLFARRVRFYEQKWIRFRKR